MNVAVDENTVPHSADSCPTYSGDGESGERDGRTCATRRNDPWRSGEWPLVVLQNPGLRVVVIAVQLAAFDFRLQQDVIVSGWRGTVCAPLPCLE